MLAQPVLRTHRRSSSWRSRALARRVLEQQLGDVTAQAQVGRVDAGQGGGRDQADDLRGLDPRPGPPASSATAAKAAAGGVTR